jgi:hypothetical protein
MKRSVLLEFLRRGKHAVEASSGLDGPQAAVVGIAVSDDFELVFDTLDTTRKAANLRRDSRVAFVIGGSGDDDVKTVQLSGVADEPVGDDLVRCKQLYFARFADGPSREAWKGITYFRVRPTWLRYSDYGQDPPLIVEFTVAELAALDAPIHPLS